LAAPDAFAQNKGTLRGSEMAGFGRLLFILKEAPRVSATVTSGVLVITFDSPVDVDPERLAQEIPAYVGAARRDPDGKGLRIALARPVRPSIKEAGERIFIDLLPTNWTGQPPGLPQDVIDELARRAREAEEQLRLADRRRIAEQPRAMPVRIGLLPTFTRLVFEMPVVAAVTHKRVGDRFEIVFDAAFRVDAAKIKADLGSLVRTVEADLAGAVSRVTIAVPEGVETFGFREDDTFVVDLVPADERARRAAAAAPAPAPEKAEAKPDAKAEAKPEVKPAAAAAKPPEPAPPTLAKPIVAPDVAKPIPAAAQAKLDPVKPTVSRDGETVRIALAFAGGPPAALFERNGVVTALFETEQGIEDAETPTAIRALGGAWRFSQIGGARVMRIVFGEPKLARLAPEGGGWVVTLGERYAATSAPIAPARAIDDNGRTVISAPLERVGRIHWIEDPDTGERIAVAPAPAPLRAIAKPYRFPEFEMPPTAHGVVVVALADDLTVRSGIDDVVVERGEGLAVSGRGAAAAGPAASEAPASVVFDRAAWDEALGGAARDRMRAVERRMADAAPGKRAAPRLAMARLLFARGLHQEARGAIELIVADDARAVRDRTIAMMRLAATALLRRGDDARKLLADDVLHDDPEAQLWRALVDGQQRNWSRAAAGFRAAEPILDAYPDALQAPMRAMWARAAIESRDFGAAQAILDDLDRPGARAFVRPGDIAVLRARVDEGQGRADEALAAYLKIHDGDDRPAAAEAGLRSALIELAGKPERREAALARLETVSVVWRGDAGIEPEAISALVDLYAEDNRWREAFAIARRGNESYPDNDKIRATHDRAARLFETVFAEGKSGSIDRVQALALFYDFKEFTPPGRRGDEIVRRLADRLVELDLLDSAADLLQHQIDHRVTGAQRSALAARLAVIYLLNRKPAAALAALKTTRLTELPWNVRRARNLLEARALSDLSRTDLALEMIANEQGADVDRLAADIQWQGRRWRAAGEVYERILGDRWKDRTPLDARERADVIRAAIGYSLADETLALDRLRSKFAAAMSDADDARAFQLVTSPSPARAAEIRELARQVARSDTLADFLAEYRKRYPDIPPGASRPRVEASAPSPAPAPAEPRAAGPAPPAAAPAAAPAPTPG
jgi:hypothetical protein